MDKKYFYNPNKLLSYNRILNFVIGARGIGKTYGYKSHCINRFLKYGEQFVYIKRYKTDLKGTEHFFDTVQQDYPQHEFSVYGKEMKIDGKVCGWIIPMSSWQSIKSQEFPYVTTIISDEFLLEKASKQSYMPEEPKVLLNMMDTIFRNRDNVRCICLSNAVSIVNPYFIYFGLTPNIGKRFNKYNSIVVEIPDSLDFTEERKKTKFGQLIQDTEYGAFSLNNEFINDSTVFLGKKTKDSKFKFAVIYNGLTMGVWVDVDEGLMFLSTDYDPSSKHIYALTTDDLNENNMMLLGWKNNYHLRKLVSAFTNGYLRFENQVLRNTGYEMFKSMKVQ